MPDKNTIGNSRTGTIVDSNGNVIHMSAVHYRRLNNADWPLLTRLDGELLSKLKHAENCGTPQCRAVADFFSTQKTVGCSLFCVFIQSRHFNVEGYYSRLACTQIMSP